MLKEWLENLWEQFVQICQAYLDTFDRCL